VNAQDDQIVVIAGKNGSFLLGLLQAMRLSCSNVDAEAHPQILQVGVL